MSLRSRFSVSSVFQSSASRPQKVRKSRKAKFLMESLEDRAVPAVIMWDGGAGSSNYSDAANWDSEYTPGPTDDVVIDWTRTNSNPRTVYIDKDIKVGSIASRSPLIFTTHQVFDAQLNRSKYVSSSITFTGSSTSYLYGNLFFDENAKTDATTIREIVLHAGTDTQAIINIAGVIGYQPKSAQSPIAPVNFRIEATNPGPFDPNQGYYFDRAYFNILRESSFIGVSEARFVSELQSRVTVDTPGNNFGVETISILAAHCGQVKMSNIQSLCVDTTQTNGVPNISISGGGEISLPALSNLSAKATGQGRGLISLVGANNYTATLITSSYVSMTNIDMKMGDGSASKVE
jgi:hypothetical protein